MTSSVDYSHQIQPLTTTAEDTQKFSSSQIRQGSRNPSMAMGYNNSTGALGYPNSNAGNPVRKVERNQNFFVSHSVSQSQNLRAQEIQQMAQLGRDRCESTSSLSNQLQLYSQNSRPIGETSGMQTPGENAIKAQRQAMKLKERNCKTTSPTHHFASTSALNVHNNESRIRKRSPKDPLIKKRESFADLIVIIGIKYSDFVGTIPFTKCLEQKRVTPQIVDAYPDLSNKEFAKEHNYVDNLPWICFPEGFSFKAYNKSKDEGELSQTKMFHFIITNQEGKKKYITTISFKVLLYKQSYQELLLSEKLGAFMMPKSICVVSSKPIFSLQKQLLSLIFQKVILSHAIQSIKAHHQHPTNYISFINEFSQQVIKSDPETYLYNRIELYISLFFNHLYYCEDLDKDIEVEEKIKKQKRRKKVVEDDSLSYFRYRNTKSYGFTLENYSFELLLQSLKPERILFLITALLLERKVVLIKKEFGDIALIMESLVSLLNPLQWNFIFITYLTPKLVECLEAPFPYIIGVSHHVWETYCSTREYPDDIIIFDIDNQKLLTQIREQLPPLPQPQASVLQRSLKNMLDFKESFTETIEENATKKIPKNKLEDYYWAYAQLRVKQSFFNFFLLTINNYIGYFKNLDEDGDLSPNKKDKQLYDKLSSQDVFDFDNYLNQFEGQNRQFMEKFVKTQSFNNFIEETYKNTSPKTQIGFFKTNFEVMLEHSFKRLKKEQNKLIDRTFFNLQNPVKFKISGMVKQYEINLIQKNNTQLQRLLEDFTNLSSPKHNEEGEQEGLNPAMLRTKDLLERLLRSELDANSSQQLSILNKINLDFVTDMPGIQYERISAYEQKVMSQRSDHSQERKLGHTLTQIGFKNNLQLGMSQQMSMHKFRQSQDEENDKSRNSNYIVASKSGEQILKGSKQMAHKRSGAGIIYNNFLADSKNAILLSQEDDVFTPNNERSGQGLVNLTQDLEVPQMRKGDTVHLAEIESKNCESTLSNKARVKSESSFVKNFGFGSFSLNKTVIVNSNQHSSHQNLAQTKKNSNTKDIKHQVGFQINPSLNATQNNAILDKLQPQRTQTMTSSPRVINSGIKTFNQTTKNKNAHNTSALLDTSKNLNTSQSKKLSQSQMLKEVLSRKINYERQKKGLPDEDENLAYANNSNNLSSKSQLKNSNQKTKDMDNLQNPQLSKFNSQFNKGKNQPQKVIPKTSIDLMNPKNKQISRNEERKLAQKRGFLGFEQHDSFNHFYSPDEELDNLAQMQRFQRKIEYQRKAKGMTESTTQIDFSNFINQHYNSNGSDGEDQMTKIINNNNLQLNQAQIQFQKRSIIEGPMLMNDVPPTNIDFQNNFIKQKNQMQQSPSITATEISSIRKGDRLKDFADEDGFVMVVGPDQANVLSSSNQSPQVRQRVNGAIKKLQTSPSPKNQRINLKDQQISNRAKIENKRNIIKSSLQDLSLAQQQSKVSKTRLQQNKSQEEELEEIVENRPLQMKAEDSQQYNTMNNQTMMKNHSSYNNQDTESPQIINSNQMSLKYQNKKFLEQKQHSATIQGFNQSQKSPNVQKITKVALTSQASMKNNQSLKSTQQLTFDNSSRNTTNQAKVQLQRKRSSPQIIEKSPTNNQSAIISQNTSKGKMFFDKTGTAANSFSQTGQYFKQRPVNQKDNDKKGAPVAKLQIDLEQNKKLSGVPKVSKEVDLAQLRISPIPNMSEALKKQQLNQNQASSSATSEDQVNFASNEGNRPSTNFFSQANPNFLSRGSEKLVEPDSIYQSMTNVMDAEMFDHNPLVVFGSQTVRSKHTEKTKFKGTTNSKKKPTLTHMTHSNSHRSSNNLHPHEFHSRISNLSGQFSQRQSHLSLIADFKRQEKEIDQSLMGGQKDQGRSSSKSDVYSARDHSHHNTTGQKLKTSPRTMLNQNSSRLPLTSKNMMFSPHNGVQGGQQSLMTSQDSKEINQILIAIKEQTESYNERSTGGFDMMKGNKLVLSPKGLGENYKSQIVLEFNTNQKKIARTSSIENVKANQSDSKFNSGVKGKERNIVVNTSVTLAKKQAKSPQPSSNMMSTNQYLKTLQSQEFQLKEKIKPQKTSDPMVMLQKEPNKSSNIKQQLGSNSKTSKNQNSSSKNLKLEFKDKKPSHNDSLTQLSKSTKNLYGIMNKDKLLDEINGVNETLDKIEQTKKKSNVGLKILEDALNQRNNSIGSYQNSPKLNKSQSGFSKQAKATKHSIFKTQIHLKPSQPQVETQEKTVESMATVRNEQYPVKMSHIVKQLDQEQIQQKAGENQSEHSDDVVIDFPRQISTSNEPKQVEERKSKLLQEIDDIMMLGEPITRKSKGYQTAQSKNSVAVTDSFAYQSMIVCGERSQKHNHMIQQYNQPLLEIRQNEERSQRASEGAQIYSSQQKSMSSLNGKLFPQLRSQHSENQAKHSQPLSRHSHASGSQDNSLIFQGKLQYSHQVQRESNEHQNEDQDRKNITKELGNIVMKQQRKRQLRHGLTTCFMYPNKESSNYVKRDLNQDVFCKINSHLGDIDNDPHTPKSTGSMRSIEKNKKRKIQFEQDPQQYQMIEDDINVGLRQGYTNAFQGRQGFRMHSVSVDEKILEVKRFQHEQQLKHSMQVRPSQDEEEKFFSYEREYEGNQGEVDSRGQTSQQVRYEILFEESDLRDTDDKFTSRDVNFRRL